MSEKSDAREARAEAKEQVRADAAEQVKADAAEAANAAETANVAKAEAAEAAIAEAVITEAATATKPARQTIIPGLYKRTADQSLVEVSVVDGGDEVMLRETSGERKGIGRLSAEDFLKPGEYARVIN